MNLCKELERLVSDVLDSKQTTVKTERRLLRQAVFQPRKLIVPLSVVYGIKEYLYCYLIHFCNTFDDNNRSVSFGFVEKGYRYRDLNDKQNGEDCVNEQNLLTRESCVLQKNRRLGRQQMRSGRPHCQTDTYNTRHGSQFSQPAADSGRTRCDCAMAFTACVHLASSRSPLPAGLPAATLADTVRIIRLRSAVGNHKSANTGSLVKRVAR